MTSIGSASLAVIPDFDGFGNRVQRGVNGPLTAAGVSGGRRFGDAAGRSAGARFGSVFKTAAKAGILGGLAVAATAVKLGSDAIGEAREAQKVGRLTAAVIKSTGGAAKVSEKRVGKLSERLSEMAGIDDEIVQGGANTLLTFKNIRNEAGKGNKVFDEATKAALNLSVGLGRDLTGTAIQVGKALNDPIRGVTALSRAGVQFSDQQKDQIKTLTESGDLLGAQKIILGELTTQFDGAAKSQANSSERLGVAFDNVKEKLGKALLPVLDDVARFLRKEAIPAAEDFVGWFQDEGIPGIKTFADEVKPLANKFLPAAADGFRAIRDFGKAALPYAEGIVGAFNDMPSWAKKALVGGAAAGFAANKVLPGGAKGAGGSLLGLVTKAKPLPVFVVNNGVGVGGSPKGGPLATGTKFGKLIPIIGSAGVVGLAVAGIAVGGPIQVEGFKDAAGSPTGLNPGARVLPSLGSKDDPDKTARAYVNLGNQFDLSKAKLSLFRDEAVKFNSTVDKTPRQVEVLFKSKGYLERMREIELLNAALATVGAGGVPNSGGETTPRGFGSDGPVFGAGSNVTIQANTTAEIAAAGRDHKRKRSRAGWD
jgi:hypothetical protein